MTTPTTSKPNPTFEQLNRYLFADRHARGELVQLEQSFQMMIANHNYPAGVSQLLGELLVATSLLTATLKFAGEISVQLQGDGPVAYMVINGNDQQQMRGIAKFKANISDEEKSASGLQSLIGKGTMVITLRPLKGEAYQGVVALEHENLAACLSHYFAVSEQIPTKLWLFVDHDKKLAAGSLLQLLPDGDDKNQQQDDFDHLCQLTHTIKADEIFTLPASELLYRLYHQEEVRLFEPQSVTYQCGCSEDKCFNAISQIKPSEIRSILDEQGKITMTCDYCQTVYDFDQQKLAGLLTEKKH
jgi:molecular chaperone Hsp33